MEENKLERTAKKGLSQFLMPITGDLRIHHAIENMNIPDFKKVNAEVSTYFVKYAVYLAGIYGLAQLT